MTLYDVPAPAKINLFLHVTGRRPDGYHLLESVFRFVGLYDTLNFDLRRDGRISREGDTLAGLSADDDLVVRAARVLQQATGTKQGVQIRYTKAIPAGAGLGGGSSDAASTLIALNRLWGTGLDRQSLMRLALPLGADVPVFIYGQPAFARGIGEILEPVQVAERAYIVAQPPQAVPTGAIFSSPDLTRNSGCVKIAIFTEWHTKNAPEFGFFGGGFFGRNDLEPVVFTQYPRVAAAAQWLTQQGVSVRMSGSGSCLFAEFVTQAQASMFQQDILGKIRRENGNEGIIRNIWACPGLMDHPLRSWTRN